MSVKTVEKRRKGSWSLYLMLCKGRYKAWVSDEALLHLSFTTGKTMIQYISHKSYKDAAVLQKTSWASGVMEWMECPLKA
ncbi:hypothetical protein TNCV_2404501 [Trichonephila clavipes]|nr:hypothetical protein TNCV_2404501 [Trichonephila clavipes]